MAESAFARTEKEGGRMHLGIFRVEEEGMRELAEFWSIMRDAIRNPKSEKEVTRFDARVSGMLNNREERKIFELLEKEMKNFQAGKNTLEIRKDEADAFFAYTGAGRQEEKISSLLELRRDAEKCSDALAVLDARLENTGAQDVSKVIDIAQRGDATADDIKAIIGRNREPELADALYTLLSKQEAASLAARGKLEFDREDYKTLFGIESKNELIAALQLYRKALGDAKFAKARESAMRGDAASVFSEIRKLGLAAQYVFLSLIAPGLIRNGMWNSKALGIIGKALEAVRKAARKKKADGNRAQTAYLGGMRKFTAKFADFRGLNLSLFSAAFVASIK